MGKLIRVDFGTPSRFAHWRNEAPPPRWPLARLIQVGVSAATLVLALYGCYRVLEYWTTTPAEPPVEPRKAFGYFAPDLLRAGDCFNDESIETAVRAGDSEAHETLPPVAVVPCGSPHSAEIFALFDIDSGHKYPTGDQVAQASGACDDALAAYVSRDGSRRRVMIWAYPPPYTAWERGHPEGICVAVDRTAHRHRGSLADGS